MYRPLRLTSCVAGSSGPQLKTQGCVLPLTSCRSVPCATLPLLLLLPLLPLLPLSQAAAPPASFTTSRPSSCSA
jgi:hypothetical protein